MRRFIQKLRQKPKSTRRKIAFGTSASITGVIFVVWLTVLVAGGSAVGGSVDQSKTASPLGALESNANSAFTQVRDQLSASVASRGSSTASSQESTSTAPTGKQEGGSAQSAGGNSYWKTQEKSTQDEDTSDQTKQESVPPSQAGNDFWQNSSEADNEGGWFQ